MDATNNFKHLLLLRDCQMVNMEYL